MEMIKDMFHDHTLELIPFDKKADIRSCVACAQEIIDSTYYSCPEDGCDFFLHMFCGELPIETEHGSHPSHPLELFLPHQEIWCNACRKNYEGIYYGCVQCFFFLDLICATLADSKLAHHGHPHPFTNLINSSPRKHFIAPRNPKMLKDLAHRHTLELIPLDKKADIRSCVACTQEIIDNTYYSCPQLGCHYFLHKYCAELPVEINHGFHQTHPLRLIPDPHRKCNACREKSKGFSYRCEECDFNLDLICATLADRKVEHPGHPHPLTPTKSEIKAFCNCCGEKHQGIFYHCEKCAIFWIHQDCAALGLVVDAPNHPHPLHLVYLPKSLKTIKCELCHEKLGSNRSWYLQCVPCEFLSHVNCAMHKRESDEDEESEIDDDAEVGDVTLRLPAANCDEEFGCIGLSNKKIARNDGEMKITHFSHPEHELIFHNQVPKVEDQYSGHQISFSTKCNGCTRKISGGYYSCLDCDFFLHKWCALLPTHIMIKHPGHKEHCDSNLVQSIKTWRVEDVFKCSCCGEYCNGFSFECEAEDCKYKVDLECVILPRYIVHESHPFHRLTFHKLWGGQFGSCCKQSRRTSIYFCGVDNCGFKIHACCAMFPAKVSHRYDHENLFKLWYDRSAVEANYFYCERCEQYMDPKEWYYHSKSSIGDQLLHPRCILQREDSEMLKFKSTKSFLQVDIHPHRLHISVLTSYQLYSESCSYCKERFTELKAEVLRRGEEVICEKRDSERVSLDHSFRLYLEEEFADTFVLFYNCWEPHCDFKLHSSCAMKLRGENSGVEEYPDENS